MPPSFPCPPYLVLLAFALRLSCRIFSRSPRRVAISEARFRTGVSVHTTSVQAAVGLTIDTLIFALLVDIVERSQHLDRRDMCSCVINDPLGPVLDEEFEKGQGLVSVASR